MLRKNITAAVLAASVLMLGVAGGCQPVAVTPVTPAVTAPVSQYKAGDSVIAVWSGSMWYEGTVNGPCATGVEVKWTDGSAPSCVSEAKVAWNKPLLKADAKVGAKVFAQWTSSSYYEAEITKVDGENLSVKYSDGFTKDGLKLSQFKMR